MVRVTSIIFAAALLITLPAIGPVWAQSGNYRHVLTIYDDGQGNNLLGPAGVACDGDRLVIADSRNNRILFYTFRNDTANLTREVKLARQIQPTIVQIDAGRQLLVYDSRAKQILRFDPDGNRAGMVEPRDVTGTSRVILKSFRVDGKGNIYLLDVFGRRVVVLDQSGAFGRQIPFPDGNGFISDLSVDGSGRVLILDSVRSLVLVAEPGAETFNPLSGNLQDILVYPTHIEVDSKGMIYVVDEETSSVGVLRRDGSFLRKMFNRGRKEGLLYYPSQICVDDDMQIIIADRDNNRVQVFKEKE
jgi:hypothetical protein